LRCGSIAPILLFLGVSAGLAQQGGVILDSNEQLTTILAARIAAGVEPAAASEAGLEARQYVSSYLARRKIPVSAELRAFFSENQVGAGSGDNLSQYVSLALLMGPPPDYKPTAPQTDLPPDAKRLVGLVPLLKSFYDQANMTDLWAQLQPRIQQEIDRQSPAIRRSIELSDAYLRFPSGAYLGRTYAIILSLLGTPEQVHARIYGQNYYLVVTPSKEPKLAEIRHQYLHFLLDPLAVKYATETQQKAELKFLVRPAPLLGADFKEDFTLFVIECLIRAVELRLDKRPVGEAQKSLEELAASGFILAPYFYSSLTEYEKQDSPMSVALKEIIPKIQVAQEKEKAAKIQFTPKPEAAAAEQSPALSEEEALLNQGENLIAEGKYVEARDVFRTVLDTMNARSERGLFGMAMVASNTRKPGLAEEYFRKTLEVAQDLRIVTWSHIYLGRLYDLETNRTRALAEYRAASLTAASFPDAWRAVQDGLQRPFGFHK
jgi:tetratricopeptide (TPR) repeat protein